MAGTQPSQVSAQAVKVIDSTMNQSTATELIRTTIVVCPNPSCEELTAIASLGPWEFGEIVGSVDETATTTWPLLPEANVQQIADYVPNQYQRD